jgi:predicted GIY-YIG superfamily endonuclease
MNERFNILVKEMPKLLEELKNKPLLARDELKKNPQKQKGIYVFYENNKPLYVGRSNNLKSRIQQHGRESSMHNSASFAFRLAKEEMSRHRSIPKDVTRKELENAPGFAQAFWEARHRVAEMKVRVIEIEDQIEQALFEIYAHLALKTKYNDFSTH